MTDLLRYSTGALLGHRIRSALSLLGVAIGVAAVIVLTALGEGVRRYVTDQFASIGSNLVIIIPGRTETTGAFPGVAGATNDLTLADADAVARHVPQVRRMAPIAMGTETVAHGERRRQVAIIGSNHEMLDVRKLRLARGSFLPPAELRRGAPLAVLGHTVARELFPASDAVGQVVRIAGLRARVIGVLDDMGTQLGVDLNEVAIIPVATAMRLFDARSLARIMIEVRSGADLDAARKSALALLAERHGDADVTAVTQDAVVSAFTSILRTLTLALAAIALISLTVAGIGIMNVMLVSVSERTSEIGLLKALGVARGQILAVFLAEAALLSSTGGGLGLAVGWLLTRVLVAVYPALPATPPLWAVGTSLVLSAAVGILFGLLPARRATRLDPIAALAGH